VMQRLLVEPETDLLARPLAPDEAPDAIVSEVRRAVFDGRRLRIHYAASGQPPASRTVDPIGLVSVREQCYLLAMQAGAQRTYRLSRILTAEALDMDAQRPDGVDLKRIWKQSVARFRHEGSEQVCVLARVSPTRREDLVATALAVLSEQADPDGWLRLEASFQDARHALWALWQLGADAEAIAPASVRDALRGTAEALARRYGAG